MTISAKLRSFVIKRAGFACEFCGVAESDAGGELTIDHFRPQAKGGTDGKSNLVYSCSRCNLYKADYWPGHSGDPQLWNPRSDSHDTHLLELANGTLFPVSKIGNFTLRRFRLNRPQLVAYRRRRFQEVSASHLLSQTLLQCIEDLQKQLSNMRQEQQVLLKQQRRIIRLLLGLSHD